MACTEECKEHIRYTFNGFFTICGQTIILTNGELATANTRYAVRQSSSPMGSLLPQIQGGHHHEQTKLEKRFLYFMDRTGYHRLGGLIRRAKSKMDDEYWISILEKQIISIKSGAVLAVPLFA